MTGTTRRDMIQAVGGLIAAGGSSLRAVAAAERTVWGEFETPGVRFLLQARVTVRPMIDFGATSRGERRVVPIAGGRFRGPRLAGAILDEGEDTQVVRTDGVTEIVARYALRTHDGVLIYVVNRGLIDRGADVRAPAPGPAGPPARPRYVRTIPQFEAPVGSAYAWLNRRLFVGTLDPLPPAAHAVIVRFFELT
jgi:Protein of unknown function (DUF3237)